MVTGVTAWFGFQELGKAQAIFYAMGVLAFGLTCVFLWLRITSIVGIFRRLSVAALQIPNAAVDGSKNNQVTLLNGINIQAVLRNDSQLLMFYRLRRANNSIESKVPPKHAVDRTVLIVPPNGGVSVINMATIEDVRPKNKDGRFDGHLELEVEYGPAEDSLDYLLRYVADIQIVFGAKPGAAPNTKEFQYTWVNSIRQLEHLKA